MRTPTSEQAAILAAADRGSVLIRALAGTGKTSTLEMLAPRLGEGVAIAFNVKMKEELASRLPPTFKAQTLNGAGHSAWGRLTGKKLTLDHKKAGRLSGSIPIVRALLNSARTLGLVPESRARGAKVFLRDAPEGWEEVIAFSQQLDVTPVHIDATRKVLEAAISEGFAGKIDFTDQIYLSACFNGAFQKTPNLFVDEAQDLSPLNHYMVGRMIGGRVVAVGDERQAMYGFRGASSNSMAEMEEMLRRRGPLEVLPLNTCFRCSEAVIASARKYVPDISAAPGALYGRADFLEEWSYEDFTPGCAILCRNNAPLFRLGLTLLREGYSINFQGKDAGEKVIVIVDKVDKPHQMSRTDLFDALHTYSLSLKSSALEWVNDCIAILEAIPGATTFEILQGIETLLRSPEGAVTLSTGHRAKGMEWHTVYHLDPWRIPSKHANTPEALQQEENIAYVIETRAKENLFFINSL